MSEERQEHYRRMVLLATLQAEMHAAIKQEREAYRFPDQGNEIEVVVAVSSTKDHLFMRGDVDTMECLLAILEDLQR